MEESIFRKKSLERLSAPDQLNDYLHVTKPSVWAVLAGAILILAALIAWANFTAIESYAAGTAEIRNGVMTMTFDDAYKSENVKAGQTVTIGGVTASILSVGKDGNGNVIASAKVNIPDGTYSAKVGYDVTQVIDLLLD